MCIRDSHTLQRAAHQVDKATVANERVEGQYVLIIAARAQRENLLQVVAAVDGGDVAQEWVAAVQHVEDGHRLEAIVLSLIHI